MLVAAPIMCVGGVIMALREDVGLSWLMLVVRPGARRLSIGLDHRPDGAAVPGRCSRGSTRVNRVLREQITGIRVVRAFVREPHETAGSTTPTPSSPTPRCAPAGCRR